LHIPNSPDEEDFSPQDENSDAIIPHYNPVTLFGEILYDEAEFLAQHSIVDEIIPLYNEATMEIAELDED